MKTTVINGVTYEIKRHRVHGPYVRVPVEQLTVGMVIDHGTYVAHTEAMFDGAINPNTWDVWLSDGLRYTESRGAQVRVWIDEHPDLHPRISFMARIPGVQAR